jgi:hypothetical protein
MDDGAYADTIAIRVNELLEQQGLALRLVPVHSDGSDTMH